MLAKHESWEAPITLMAETLANLQNTVANWGGARQGEWGRVTELVGRVTRLQETLELVGHQAQSSERRLGVVENELGDRVEASEAVAARVQRLESAVTEVSEQQLAVTNAMRKFCRERAGPPPLQPPHLHPRSTWRLNVGFRRWRTRLGGWRGS